MRAHGRKAGIFQELLRRPPEDLDVLLMEGTHIREDSDGSERGPSERDVEDACVDTCKETEGMVLAMSSPQNIDRLVTMYRACLRSGRDLVIDLYTAAISAATWRDTIPRAAWDRVRVYLPRSQRARVIREQAFDRTEAVKPHRIYAEELVARRGELVMLFRASMRRELEEIGCLEGARCIWSMWPGYLREPSGERLRAWLDRLGIPMVIHHASGHAFISDLQRLVRALAPRRVVPIHSFAGDRFGEFFPHVERRNKLRGDSEAMAFLQMILASETCSPLNHLSVRFLLGCLCSDSWYRVHGGSERLAKTLLAKCHAKGRMTLSLRTRVNSVQETDGGVTVHWIKGGGRYHDRFDAVIVAAPKGEKLAGMKRRGHFHSYVSVLLQYGRAWWNEENPSLRQGFMTGFYTDGPLNYVQQASRTPRGRRTLRVLLPDAERKLAWRDDRIRHFCVTALRSISSVADKPVRWRITRWSDGLPCGGRKEKAKRISARVFLAGDRFGEWPSMNAAIVSGKQAARLLSAELD